MNIKKLSLFSFLLFTKSIYPIAAKENRATDHELDMVFLVESDEMGIFPESLEKHDCTSNIVTIPDGNQKIDFILIDCQFLQKPKTSADALASKPKHDLHSQNSKSETKYNMPEIKM